MTTPPTREELRDRVCNPVAIEKKRRAIANTFLIEDDYYYGIRDCYESYFKVKYPELTWYAVDHLLRCNKFSEEHKQQYPELDPTNPNKIWDMVKRGAIAKAHEVRGYKKVAGNYGLIYYVVDKDYNRYYGFTTNLETEFCEVKKLIANGFLSVSREAKDYSYHAYEILCCENGYDAKAREVIDSLILEFVARNPDKRAVNIIDFVPFTKRVSPFAVN